MIQNSLFGNVGTKTGRFSATKENISNTPKAAQNDLFGNGQRAKRPDPPVTPVPQDTSTPGIKRGSVPDIGETVIALNLNDGIEGVVQFIDYPNLALDYMYPIQLYIPKLNNMMFRTSLDKIRRIKQ